MVKNYTYNLCLALGWQGGTIHQVSKEVGLSVGDILSLSEYDIRANNENNFTFEEKKKSNDGFSSVLFQTTKYRKEKIYKNHIGCPFFWQGVSKGVQHLINTGDYNGHLKP